MRLIDADDCKSRGNLVFTFEEDGKMRSQTILCKDMTDKLFDSYPTVDAVPISDIDAAITGIEHEIADYSFRECDVAKGLNIALKIIKEHCGE